MIGDRARGWLLPLAASLTVCGTAAAAGRYNINWGPHPDGATDPEACDRLSKIWWSSPDAACQGTTAQQPVCDRASAVYQNQVATLISSTQCNVSWQFMNKGSTYWSPWSASFAIRSCPEGYEISELSNGECVLVVDVPRARGAPKSCPYGNPIYPDLGTKREEVDVGLTLGGIRIALTYDTAVNSPGATDARPANPVLPVLGSLWFTSVHRGVLIQTSGSTQSALVARGGGQLVSFLRKPDGSFAASDADARDRLVPVTGGYLYYDSRAGSVEKYDAQGKLGSITSAEGQTATFSYSTAAGPNAPAAGYLVSIKDAYAREVKLTYDLPASADPATGGRLRSFVDPSGRSTLLNFDGVGNLSQIVWPDTFFKQFLYESAQYAWALTGIQDENLARQSSFSYDGDGRATGTQRAGGVDAYTVSYATPPGVKVTSVFDALARVIYRYHDWEAPAGTALVSPNGSPLGLETSSIGGKTYVTSRSQPAGAGCAASSASLGYDGNGNVVQSDDFNGNRSCMAYDLGRNLQTARIEGLPLTADCKSLLTATALPVGSRKSATQWHPDWALATRVAEPGRITTTVYNGQPDPFNGNAPANCAPATAVLPDGKPIVVVCKKVEQATAGTDTTGVLGLDAPLDGTVPARTWAYTYNGNGQMLSANGPRAAGDANDSTTYEYWSDTVFTGTDPDAQGHTLGDLKRVTNALGQAVQYTKYNKTGQLLESIDANQVLTVNTYDARQRLLSSQVGSELTRYEYHPTGLLKKVTQPDNVSFVKYTYDDAHRLSLVEDHLGNSVKYELDNLGNRVSETVKDPGGAMRRTLGRSIDALGRVQQLTGRQ